ncbi:hypothetical protein BC940DRAFT_369088 [Gongronella butleri]|nr:hypothetical protein BC940DRAFT_369088 [Gongronella butleri]
MHVFPDDVATRIFENLPGDDLKTLRLCQKHWNILSSPLLFRKVTFCLDQPQDKQMEQLDFLTTPLTCSNNVTPGYLVRDLFFHHQHDATPLALLPRLNGAMPWIKYLDIDVCRCAQLLEARMRMILNRTISATTGTSQGDSEASSLPDVNASWQAAVNQWPNLLSVAVRSILNGPNGPRIPSASTLVTHLNLSCGMQLQLDVITVFQLPSLFPSLHYLSCVVKRQSERIPSPESVTNAILQHLNKLLRTHKMDNGQLVMSQRRTWPFIAEMNLWLALEPLDTCYFMLVLAMIAPDLKKLTHNTLCNYSELLGPMEVPLEAARACVLSNGLSPSFNALQSYTTNVLCVNELMVSALFRKTQQLEHLDVGWVQKKFPPGDYNDDRFHDYTPEHVFFRQLAHISKLTIRHFAFSNGGSGTRVSQLLTCLDIPAFAHLVKLETTFINEICLHKLFSQMPQLEELVADMPSCGDRDTGAPIVKYPTRCVPHALKKMNLTVKYYQFLGTLDNIANINPGIINYAFDSVCCFDPSTRAPDQDDALFTWLVPCAQKMVMDLHHWACAPDKDARLSWMCFPSCHLAGLDIRGPMMLVDDFGEIGWDGDDFGAVVVYQADPGPDVAKLHLYYAGDDGRQLDKPLHNELDLVGSLEEILPDLQRRQKENRQYRWDTDPDLHFEAIGPATATVLMVLATKIDILTLNLSLSMLIRTN